MPSAILPTRSVTPANCCPIEGVLKQAAALTVEVLACECADAGFCNLSDSAGVEVYAAKCAVEVNDPEGAVGIKVHCDNAAAELTDFGNCTGVDINSHQVCRTADCVELTVCIVECHFVDAVCACNGCNLGPGG